MTMVSELVASVSLYDHRRKSFEGNSDTPFITRRVGRKCNYGYAARAIRVAKQFIRVSICQTNLISGEHRSATYMSPHSSLLERQNKSISTPLDLPNNKHRAYKQIRSRAAIKFRKYMIKRRCNYGLN